MHHLAKFRQNRSNRGRDIGILDFSRWRPPPSWILKFQIFNGRDGQEGRTYSISLSLPA